MKKKINIIVTTPFMKYDKNKLMHNIVFNYKLHIIYSVSLSFSLLHTLSIKHPIQNI